MVDTIAGIVAEMREVGLSHSPTVLAWADRLAALSASSGGVVWQPIATVPRDEKKVVVLQADGSVSNACYNSYSKPTATHWMTPAALAAAPKVSDVVRRGGGRGDCGLSVDSPQADPDDMEHDFTNAVRGAVIQKQADPAPSVARRCNSSVLRAMAHNYRGGHSWDHLDAEACTRAADEIDDHARIVAEKDADNASLRDLVEWQAEQRKTAEARLDARAEALAKKAEQADFWMAEYGKERDQRAIEEARADALAGELRNWLDANDGLSKTAACIKRTRALLNPPTSEK